MQVWSYLTIGNRIWAERLCVCGGFLIWHYLHEKLNFDKFYPLAKFIAKLFTACPSIFFYSYCRLDLCIISSKRLFYKQPKFYFFSGIFMFSVYMCKNSTSKISKFFLWYSVQFWTSCSAEGFYEFNSAHPSMCASVTLFS